MVLGTIVAGLVLSEKQNLDLDLKELNTIYVCLAAVGMLISTYLCVQDELGKGFLNVVTVINEQDSDYFQASDEQSMAENEQ